MAQSLSRLDRHWNNSSCPERGWTSQHYLDGRQHCACSVGQFSWGLQAVILNNGFTWGRHQRRRSNVEPAYCQRSAREHGADEPWAERRDNCIRLALNEGQNYVTSLKKATLYSVITQSHNAVAAHFSRGQLLSLVLRNVLGYAVHCGDGSADLKVINQGRVHFSWLWYSTQREQYHGRKSMKNNLHNFVNMCTYSG